MTPALIAALGLLGRLLGGAVAGAIRKRQEARQQSDEAEELLVGLLVDSDNKDVRKEVAEALLSLMRENRRARKQKKEGS